MKRWWRAWIVALAAIALQVFAQETAEDLELAAATQAAEIEGAAILRASSRDGGALRKALLRREVGVAALQEALRERPDVNTRGSDGHTPLTVAAFILASSADRAELLLAAGADANGADARGNTPLYYALRRGDHALVATLLRAGAKVERVALGRYSALQVAIRYGRIEQVPALVTAGANAADTVDGWSVEHTAARLGKLELVSARRLLPERINVRGPGGTTPLIVAAKWGRANLVHGALQAGAAVDLADDEGRTALMWAAERGFVDAVKALLAAGADPKRAAKDGASAYVLAGRRGEAGVQSMLLARGVKPETVQLADEAARVTMLPPNRRRALALAALDLHVAWFSLGALTADAAENARAARWLTQSGIADRRALRAECEKLVQAADQNRPVATEAEARAKEEELLTNPVALAAWKAQQRSTPGGALAAQLTRHNFLVVLGARAGWLSERQAWEALVEAERKIAAARLDWPEIGASACRRLEQGAGNSPAQLAAMEKLLRDENSATALWHLAPWN